MRKSKIRQRLTAMMLSIIMVVTMLPVTALAETSTFPIGTSGEIIAFEVLAADISMQSVPLGTNESDLKLPNILTATLRIAALDEEPVLGSGETDTKLYSTDTVSGSAIGMDEITVPLPVTWTSSPEYDGKAADTYIFIPELPEGITLASDVEVPVITVGVGATAPTGTVKAFDELPPNVRWQNTTMPVFPKTVSGTVEDETADILVIWEPDHDYDAEFPEQGLYVFTAVLGEGYSVEDGVEFPRITVYIPQTIGRMMARMASGVTTYSPLEISTAAQLAEIAILVNARPNGLESFLFNNADAHVTLELQNDIDLTYYGRGEGWVPIGNESNPFKGTFDGSGHKIKNLTINRNANYQGLFGYISVGSMVKNLGIESADILAKEFVGSLAGHISAGAVKNCYSIGSVSGANNIGGLVGTLINSTLSNCAALNSSVTGTSYVGRVVGYMSGGTLAGNIAFYGMTIIEDGSEKELIEGADQVDGWSKTAAEIKAAGFFEALFDNDTAWTYAEGKLPGFGKANDMPWYLVDGGYSHFIGEGTSENPYQIHTHAHLAKLAELVNAGDANYNAAHYKLVNDLDLSSYNSGEGWVPIGIQGDNFEGSPVNSPFMGTFDGGGNKITGLYITYLFERYITEGLFGYLKDATVKNLGVVESSVNAHNVYNVGGLAGKMEGGLVQNCYVIGSVGGSNFVGGVVGRVNGGIVQNCWNSGQFFATGGASCSRSGGVAGIVEEGGIIENCYSTATVDGTRIIGGVVGYVAATGTVQNCFSTGNIGDNYGRQHIGGVVGLSYGVVKNCAALNASVSSESTADRVVAYIETSSDLSGNIAYDGMTVNGYTVTGGTLTNTSGADKSSAEINRAGFWTTTSGFTADWDTSVWNIEPGKLPILRNVAGQDASMPTHLLPEGTSFFEGAGTSESDPYLIKTAADLAKLATLVNNGNSYNGKFFRLVNNLDLSAYGKDYDGGKGWMPIGRSKQPFSGLFDGGGNTITGLYIERCGHSVEHSDVGLFGSIHNGTVKNLALQDVSVSGRVLVGGIIGSNSGGIVQGCSLSGVIYGDSYIGGMVGYVIDGTVQNCYSTGSVTSTNEYAGGVLGQSYSSTVQNCYSTSIVNGINEVGGLVGIMYFSTVKNCIALNSLVSGTSNIGRVVGQVVSCTLLNNYAFSRIPGTWENKGTGAKDGADVPSQTLFGGSFWTTVTNWNTSAWDSSVWTLAEGKLPTLIGLADQNFDGGLHLTARDIQYATVGMVDSFTYNANKQIPTLTVTFDGETLVKDIDYTMSVTSTDGSRTSAGTNAGEVTLTLTGKGSFYGTKAVTYTIAKKVITVIPDSDQNKKYGEIDPLLTYTTSEPLILGDTYTGELSRAEGKNVGSYAISLGSLSAGGNYELSLTPGIVNFTIEQAKVSKITTIVENVNKTAYEMRDAVNAQAVVDASGLPSSVSVITDGGTSRLPIIWSTTTAYNAKTAVYEVTGTLTGNENIDTDSISKSITVTVTPITAVNPTFSDTFVNTNNDSSVSATELGSDILPTSGSIPVEDESIAYTINWNGGETLDRTAVDNEQTFTGVINYSSPPAWLTLPSDLTVSRKITVTDKTLITIGGITTSNKTYDGTSYAPIGTVTCSHSFPTNQLEWLYESTDGAGYSSRIAPTNAGAYKLSLSVPGSNANYAGSEWFTFTIKKRQITLAADHKLIIKGSSLPELTYTVSNLAPGKIKTDALRTQPILDCPTFDGNTLGSYTITLTGGTATENYIITTRTNATLTVAEQTYTVTFNLNGGTRTGGGELIQTVAVGSSAIAPTVSRSGYTFIGWDKAFTDVTSNLTVTASWRYHGGGGGNSQDSSPIIVNPPAADKPNSPTQVEIKVPGTVDGKGNVTVKITDKTVTEAIDKALADAKENGTEQNGITVVIRVNTGSKTGSNVTVNLPRSVQDVIIAKKIVNIIIVIDNPDIRIGLDLAAVQEIKKQANTDVNITANRVKNDKLKSNAIKAIGLRPVFDLTVNYDSGKKVQNFGSGRVSVTIPYTLGINEKAGNVQAVYVDAKGKVHWLINSVYDSVEKVLRFTSDHFSTYGIGYKQANTAFKDIEGHPAKEDIEFVVSRGLISGTSKSTFSPNTAMTRGMFVTALGRLANADVSGYKKSSFTDVKKDASYMGYIEWASKNNILKGVGNKKFAPDQSITCEEMAVIMSNYAKAMGYTLPKVYVENIFADNAKINANAKEAVKQMQMAGVIIGKNDNLFEPQDTATKAEVSTMLRRFVELTISSDTAQGWRMNDSGKWIYYENGKPVTGKKDLDGTTYTFDQYGVTVEMPKNLQ